MNRNSDKKTTDTAKCVHLSASAGSGKTRALKDRYLALLDLLRQRGLNIDQAVAITFTDKAAAEIKERVMRELPEPVLKEVLRGRQDLRISTIHSFCMNLLKRYPLEAGIPPDFGVLDTRDQTQKIEKAVEEALEETDRDPVLIAPLKRFTADDLVATITFLISIRSRLKRMEIDAGGPRRLIEAVRSGMDASRAEAELKALITGSEWRSRFSGMERVLASQPELYDECMGRQHALLSRESDVDPVLRTAESIASLYFNKDWSPCRKAAISKGRFRGNDRDDYEKNFFSIQAMLHQVRSFDSCIRAAHEAESLLTLFHRAETKYQNSKMREGVLDFDDLEICAYRLLQHIESMDILYWLDRKILHFLLDEFQDTSDIQWAIIRKLTEEIFAGRGADKRVQPTLFVVGDEKQSIYRFREANYRLIHDVRRKMEVNLPADSREILTLDRNFRSTPEIMATVNQVFTSLWGEAYTAADAERREHTGSVRLIEFEPSPEEKGAGPAEARILAREIKAMITTGAIVYERDGNAGDTAQPPRSPGAAEGSKQTNSVRSGEPGANNGSGWIERKAAYGDCAVLIQSRTKLKDYEAALQAENIPYRVLGGIGFYDEDEVQSLVNVLFFLWNREDRLSLAAALKSPLFGLSEQDIFDLLQDDGNMLAALQRLRPDIGNSFQSWAEISGLIPLSGLVHRIVSETGAYVRFGSINPQAIFNIDKLLDMAREFDRRGYTNLQDFVERVKNIRRSEQRESTADINLPGFEGAISIMTVHKAKGLEYPIVFLPGMNQYSRSLSARPLVILDDAGGRVRMAVKDRINPVYDELWKLEQEELLREHQRLLYVAMTRARDHLIMIGALTNGKSAVKPDTWLAYLHGASPKPLFDAPVRIAAGISVYSCPAEKSGEDRPSAFQGQNQEKAGLSREKECESESERTSVKEPDMDRAIENLAPVERSVTPVWTKATDFIHQDKEERVENFVPADDRTVSPLTRGSILHRCLEEVTTTGGYALDKIMMGHAELRRLTDEARLAFAREVHTVITTALNDPQNALLFERRPGSYSELPFLFMKGRALVSGIMDRVVIRGQRGFVIDYKAIRIENDLSLSAWTDHYRPQISLYCEAAKQIFALESVEGYLLFLDSNKLQLCARIE